MPAFQRTNASRALQDSEILTKHDYTEPTNSTNRNMESLPAAMQVRNFGKMSQSKYTHLAAEDTTGVNNVKKSGTWGAGTLGVGGSGGATGGSGCFNCGGAHVCPSSFPLYSSHARLPSMLLQIHSLNETVPKVRRTDLDRPRLSETPRLAMQGGGLVLRQRDLPPSHHLVLAMATALLARLSLLVLLLAIQIGIDLSTTIREGPTIGRGIMTETRMIRGIATASPETEERIEIDTRGIDGEVTDQEGVGSGEQMSGTVTDVGVGVGVVNEGTRMINGGEFTDSRRNFAPYLPFCISIRSFSVIPATSPSPNVIITAFAFRS